MDYNELLMMAAENLNTKKAYDIVVLDLNGLGGIADYFVIASSDNSRHASALADYTEEFLEKEGFVPHHREGGGDADWILLDYFDFIIHIFTKDKRNYYKLDKLWGEAKVLFTSEQEI